MQWLAVFIGGGLGSLCRFGVSKLLLAMRYDGVFPLATLLSNILACAVMAAIAFGLVQNKQISAHWQLFWLVGFCGGFSTFSTFSYENWILYREGNHLVLLLNILLSVAVCFLIFMWLARKLSV